MHMPLKAAPSSLVWRDLGVSIPEHAQIVAEAESGEFRATVEADYHFEPIHSTADYGFRWRVYVNGEQAAVGVGSTAIYCCEAAQRFISDWPKYSPEAQDALLAKPF